jgi:ribose transport system substrate-binding protein
LNFIAAIYHLWEGKMLKSLKAATAIGLVAAAVTAVSIVPANAEGKFACEPGETYVMNVMVSGHPYWVPVFEGFKQAAKALGCEAVFTGTPDYDITSKSRPSSRNW